MYTLLHDQAACMTGCMQYWDEAHLSSPGVCDHITVWLLCEALPIVQTEQDHLLAHEARRMREELKSKAGTRVSCLACHGVSSMHTHLSRLQG